MKQKFFEYFEGYFNNQRQAFNYPTKFAMIELTHLRLDENRFKVSQKYVTDPETYRKTIIEIISGDLQNDSVLLTLSTLEKNLRVNTKIQKT